MLGAQKNGKINLLFGLNQQDGVENFEEKYILK
jgi:hypothetical protein